MDDGQRYRVVDLAAMGEPPGAGIHSQTVAADPHSRAVLFGFAEGEELSEHTSSKPATIHVLAGRIDLTLDGEHVDAGPGTWVRMAAGLPHALRARTPAVMLLTLDERDGGA